MSNNNRQGYQQNNNNIPNHENYQGLPLPHLNQQWPAQGNTPSHVHQQNQSQQQVILLPLMHHQSSTMNQSVSTPSPWNGQYPPPPPHIVYQQPQGSYQSFGNQQQIQSDPRAFNQQYQSQSQSQQQHEQLQHKIPLPADNNSFIQPSIERPSDNYGALNTSSSSLPNNIPNGANFARNPLPPYAIATMNNVQAKRQKVETNPGKKGFRNSRRRHRNSHLGCATCKSRRIKCDEQLPECRNCIRARLRCAYLALDESARDALKIAQEAHAARIQTLTLQSGDEESPKPPYYPYNSEGLPAKILSNPMPPFPPSNVQSLQINLQRPFDPRQPHPFQQQYQQHLDEQHLVKTNIPNNVLGQSIQPPSEVTQSTNQVPSNVGKPSPSSTSKETSESPVIDKSETYSTTSTVSSSEPRFAIDSNSYVTLSALIKDHKDVNRDLDDLAKLDGEYVEIVLDPNCTKHLNKNWPEFDRRLLEPFESGFEKDFLYKEYDLYHNGQMREAKNNVVLFKSLLSNGAALLLQYSKNEEVKKLASQQLNRDFEICLRFLNKFRIQFTQDTSNIANFYENITLCFSKFQIYQTAIPSTLYCSNSMKDNVEVTNRFFDFIISYLNDEFQVFLKDDIREKYKGNEYYERATLFNDYMHVFIVYYVQCIKSYHTAPYNTSFMNELYQSLLSIKNVIYGNLSEEEQGEFDNLENFLEAKLEYWSSIKDSPKSSTNHLQIIFYTLKKFTSILPSKTYLIRKDYSFETNLLMAYYNAVTESLKSIYPEVRFFFTYSFNGRDGPRASSYTADLIKNNETLTKEQIKYFEYPIRIIKFFKDRTGIYSQLLHDIASFPAKIVLDESNKQILQKLVTEKHLESFKKEVPKSAYPHIDDQSSSFYNKETNSIVIPSVSATKTFSNFELSQAKRVEKLKKSVEDDLTEIDQRLINRFFNITKQTGEEESLNTD